MRLAFFLLVLANLIFFSWDSGYFGGQAEGREPQRLQDQLHPEKMKVAVAEQALPAVPPQLACRMIDKLAPADAEQLQKGLQEAGGDLVATLAGGDDAPSFWVAIPALPNKAAADKKAGELKLLGVTDFHVMQSDGSFAISLGLFRSESGASEFLLGLNKKGVKSARIETRAKPPVPVRLEVRGPAELLAKRLPELLAGIAGAAAVDCP